ncbi:MAG: hypothetical protein H0U16_08090 [Actinobacteria bacterium]|nr:hypothetical protein [Actinomycetota bacterium]
MKEAMYERGRERLRMQLCPECLDEVMNESGSVRGIAGQEKKAAIHLNEPPSEKKAEAT